MGPSGARATTPRPWRAMNRQRRRCRAPWRVSARGSRRPRWPSRPSWPVPAGPRRRCDRRRHGGPAERSWTRGSPHAPSSSGLGRWRHWRPRWLGARPRPPCVGARGRHHGIACAGGGMAEPGGCLGDAAGRPRPCHTTPTPPSEATAAMAMTAFEASDTPSALVITPPATAAGPAVPAAAIDPAAPAAVARRARGARAGAQHPVQHGDRSGRREPRGQRVQCGTALVDRGCERGAAGAVAEVGHHLAPAQDAAVAV